MGTDPTVGSTDVAQQVLADRYRLLLPIGTGASSRVYVADDIEFGVDHTLKARVHDNKSPLMLHDGGGLTIIMSGGVVLESGVHVPKAPTSPSRPRLRREKLHRDRSGDRLGLEGVVRGIRAGWVAPWGGIRLGSITRLIIRVHDLQRGTSSRLWRGGGKFLPRLGLLAGLYAAT